MGLTVSIQQAEEPIAIMQIKGEIVGLVHALGEEQTVQGQLALWGSPTWKSED